MGVMKNIFLIGMMGAGKTETGKCLAKKLGLIFVDLDSEIEQEARMTVSGIFGTHGEPFFRDLEKGVLKRIVNRNSQVIATGGGIVLDPANRLLMKESGTVVYLRASVRVLFERLKEKKDRPLLNRPDPEEALARIFQDRRSLYESCHDGAVDTEGKTPREVAEALIAKLGLKQGAA